MEKIDITEKLVEFQYHLEQNPRTIFSARFGDGKTYFLREYFAKHQIWKDYTPVDERVGSVEDTYFVVLHPVNYSLAKNEDVFEYIKRDILVQLYREGKIDNIDYKGLLKSIGETLKEKALPMLGEMATLVPGGHIAKAFIDCGMKVKKKYDAEKKTASDFIDSFVKQRGSIYENDAYTKLISTTLEHLKEPKEGLKARKVLVIEDLDRMDPGHLFRILNVLGAHIDYDKDTNKFGFDNIVLVMDYDMTKHIFEYFYGKNANYEGYMNKFISSIPFMYSITTLAQEQLKQFFSDKCSLTDGLFSQTFSGDATLDAVIKAQTVRSVVHILDNVDKLVVKEEVEVEGYKTNTAQPICYLLAALRLLQKSRFAMESIIAALNTDVQSLQIMGTYLLSTDLRLHGKYVNFLNEAYKIEFVPDNNNPVQLVIKRVSPLNNDGLLSNRKVLLNAYSEAIKSVKR